MKPEIKENLINFRLSSSVKNLLFALIVLGLASIAGAFFVLHEPARHGHSNAGWSVYLIAVFIALSTAVTGVFFTSLSYISGSFWTITVRRIAETYGKFIPVGAVLLAVLLFFGLHDLYEWSHPEVVKADHLIKHKSGWLNAGFFIGRLLLITLIWYGFSFVMHKRSVQQDTDKDVMLTKKNQYTSGAFILVFALSFSIVSYDLLMSLTPHWFSTMFAIYIFSGAYQTGLSVLVILIYLIKKSGYLGDLVNENHIHDLGKFIFSFTTFWAYVAFSQFMLIWYANIPEETFFYEQRMIGGWFPLTIIVPFVKFIIPFFLLLNRPNKRNLDTLTWISAWIVFSQILELYWLVFPSNFTNFSVLGLVFSIGASLGALGLFGFVVLKSLESNKLIPVNDPRLDNSLNHHQ